MKYLFKALIISILFLSCEPDNTPDELAGIPHAPKPFVFKTDDKQFGKPDIPADNPMTLEGIELGRRLFYDSILSRDSTISCASCHHINGAFTDNRAISAGIEGRVGTRSSMAIVNLAFHKSSFFWDGRTASLEKQALMPVEDHLEMDENWEKAIQKIQKHKDYPTFFRQAFPITKKVEITKELAVKAIAQFERSIVSHNSRYDKFLKGQIEFTDAEQFGHDMFFNKVSNIPDAQCGHCHGEPLTTGNNLVNNGLQDAPTYDDFKDKGYGGVVNVKNENGKMKIVTLRNIAESAPYMHNGSLNTLEEVVEHYNTGGKYSPNKDPLIQQIQLNSVQKKQLIAFLKTLSDSTFLNNKAYMSPFK